MAGIEQLKTYHEAYKAALHICYDWDNQSAEELLRKYESFYALVSPLALKYGKDYVETPRLVQHIKCLGESLLKEKMDRARQDLRDLIHYDMPTLADYLLKLALKREGYGHCAI